MNFKNTLILLRNKTEDNTAWNLQTPPALVLQGRIQDFHLGGGGGFLGAKGDVLARTLRARNPKSLSAGNHAGPA